MNISLKRLADMVAVRLGELPDRTLHGGAHSVDLEEICALTAVEIAVRLTMSCPVERLDCVSDMLEKLSVSADFGNEGYVECELPADFLRLRRVRLYGWPRAVEEATRPDDGTAAGLAEALGETAPLWMRGQAARARCVIVPFAGNVEGFRLILSPQGSSGVEEALYIPRPKISGDELRDISSVIVEDLVKELAALANI